MTTTKDNTPNNGKPFYPPTRYSQFYLTQGAITLLDAIARKQGLRRTAVLENIIREKAKQEGL
jgi:hypothetical protein